MREVTSTLKIIGRLSLRFLARLYWLIGRGIVRISRYVRRNFRAALPVILDVAAFVVLVVGAAKLFGDWAWLAAGVLLILAGLRAQS